jgi:hypothetical protein
MVEPRDSNLTQEMLNLFERGMELVEQGHGEREFDHVLECPECKEYRDIKKRLEWRLIGLEPHCASVFDPAVDGPPHDYLSPIHCMRTDWPLVQAWRRALMAALEARQKGSEV